MGCYTADTAAVLSVVGNTHFELLVWMLFRVNSTLPHLKACYPDELR